MASEGQQWGWSACYAGLHDRPDVWGFYAHAETKRRPEAYLPGSCLGGDSGAGSYGDAWGGDEGATGDGPVSSVDDATLEMESRFVIAQEAMAPGTGGQVLEQINRSPDPNRRIRLAAIAAAIGGPEAGREWLADLQGQISEMELPLSESQSAEIDGLDRLFAGSASEGVALDMEERLGWFGQVAVDAASDDRVDRLKPVVEQSVLMASMVMVAIIALGVVGLVGLVLLVLYIVRAVQRQLPRTMAPAHSWDGVYAETFAIWIILLQVLLAFSMIPGMSSSSDWRMTPTLVAFFLSLFALAWPVLRGVSWQDVKADIGWTQGAGLVREVGCGVIGYAMAIPIVAIGLLITLLLIFLSAPEEGAGAAAHPIVGEVAGGGWIVRLQVLVLASIAAPIVEETMFRGVLYRQVRTSAGRFPRWGSVVIAAAVTSLVFALIHPQGMLAVPVLSAMAVAFAIAREWRGSLVAPMVMHGMSNGIVMTTLMMMFG